MILDSIWFLSRCQIVRSVSVNFISLNTAKQTPIHVGSYVQIHNKIIAFSRSLCLSPRNHSLSRFFIDCWLLNGVAGVIETQYNEPNLLKRFHLMGKSRAKRVLLFFQIETINRESFCVAWFDKIFLFISNFWFCCLNNCSIYGFDSNVLSK